MELPSLQNDVYDDSRLRSPAPGNSPVLRTGYDRRSDTLDVLNVNYWRRDGKVVVYIRLDPDVEKALENVNEPFLRGMMRR
jgi:hypothetical protein